MTRLLVAPGDHWKARPKIGRATTRAALVGEWKRALTARGVQVARSPLAWPQSDQVLRLPRSAQALFVIEAPCHAALEHADELHALVGDHGHADPLGLEKELRVVLALPSGWFYGFRPTLPAPTADSIHFARCEQCWQWSFVLASGSRRCRCCHQYGAVIGRFTNTLPLRRADRLGS